MCHDALSLWPICVAVNGSKTPSQRLPPPPRNENWSEIRDPVERRKIQNRIAQRNYRKERVDTGLHSFAKARVGKRSKQRLALLRSRVLSERTSSELDSRTDVRPCEPQSRRTHTLMRSAQQVYTPAETATCKEAALRRRCSMSMGSQMLCRLSRPRRHQQSVWLRRRQRAQSIGLFVRLLVCRPLQSA